MSVSAKRMRPESGMISPVNCPINVVLPAPFGPMIACNSPTGTASETFSDAVTPPKRLLKSSICRSASATTQARQQAVDAAAREQNDEEQHRPEDERPIFLGGRDIPPGDDMA